jgi:hypothetical protein
MCVSFARKVSSKLLQWISAKAPSRRRRQGQPPVFVHKKGPEGPGADARFQPKDAYIVRLSMEWIPARALRFACAGATPEYSKGMMLLRRPE